MHPFSRLVKESARYPLPSHLVVRMYNSAKHKQVFCCEVFVLFHDHLRCCSRNRSVNRSCIGRGRRRLCALASLFGVCFGRDGSCGGGRGLVLLGLDLLPARSTDMLNLVELRGYVFPRFLVIFLQLSELCVFFGGELGVGFRFVFLDLDDCWGRCGRFRGFFCLFCLFRNLESVLRRWSLERLLLLHYVSVWVDCDCRKDFGQGQHSLGIRSRRTALNFSTLAFADLFNVFSRPELVARYSRNIAGCRWKRLAMTVCEKKG